MPGASPTISRRASSVPNERTGALPQSGYCALSSCRKATSRGQRGQSGDGSSKRDAATNSDRLRGADQRFGRRFVDQSWTRHALRRVARNERRKLGQLDEVVGLAAQLVGHHGWRGLYGADHGDAQALALYRFDQAAEVAVAGEQDHM